MGLDEPARHRRRMQPAPAHLAQIGTLPGVERVTPGRGFVQKILYLGRNQMLVGDQTHRRKLLGPRRRAARGHHRGGVPMEHRNRLLE